MLVLLEEGTFKERLYFMEAGKREEGVSESPGEHLVIQDKGQEENIDTELTQHDTVRVSSRGLYGLYVKGFVNNVCVN